jgi:hypothetical protein
MSNVAILHRRVVYRSFMAKSCVSRARRVTGDVDIYSFIGFDYSDKQMAVDTDCYLTFES